jgi:hypothetical protein
MDREFALKSERENASSPRAGKIGMPKPIQKKPRTPSLASEQKVLVQERLKQAFPDRYSLFRLKAVSWAGGGEVRITWTDGPSYDTVEQLLAPLKEQSSRYISPERHYSPGFLTRVATEYCQCKNVPLPGIRQSDDGNAYLDHLMDIQLERAIRRELARLDERDIPTLAYRLHLIGDEYQPVQSCVVRRRDYSHGRYPELAIIRVRSYTQYLRALGYVRRRINDDWVEVVDGVYGPFMDHVWDLESHVAWCKQYGRSSSGEHKKKE